MKRLLFIMDTFPLGGISKSLLALLREIEGKYNVDLLLMKKEGLFVPLIPSYVHILSNVIEEEFREPHPKYIFKNYHSLSFFRWLDWICFSLRCTIARILGGLHRQVQVMDQYIGTHSQALSEIYDAGIAYQGGRCIYYLVEKVQALKKIGYVHSNYSENETDSMLKPIDEIYFPYLDYIVSISNVCVESLKKEFPMLSDRCRMIENICSPLYIQQLSNLEQVFNDGWTGLRILTMGRLDIHIKGIDLAIEAAGILLKKNISFRWYWLGDGDERLIIEKMIAQHGLDNHFILLGAKVNPYPYVKKSDIYVQPSRIEGKSVALDEVKVLGKPIVVTKFATVEDQFRDGENALFSNFSPMDIAKKILLLSESASMREHFMKNLAKEKIGNEEQALIFETLID